MRLAKDTFRKSAVYKVVESWIDTEIASDFVIKEYWTENEEFVEPKFDASELMRTKVNRCSMYLGMGHGVSLGALGSFKPVVRSIVTQTEEDANANTITNKVVRFYPGKALKEAVKGLVMEELDKKRD